MLRPKRHTADGVEFSNKKQKLEREDSVHDQENTVSDETVEPTAINPLEVKNINASKDKDNSDEDSDEDSNNDSEEEEDIIAQELDEISTDTSVLKDNYLNVKEEIQKTEPNAKDLLSVPLRLEDRAKLTQYYNFFDNFYK